MKLDIEIVVRIVFPSHSLLVSSFLLFLPSLSHCLAFYLYHALAFTTFLFFKLSFSHPFSFTMSLSWFFSLKTSLFLCLSFISRLFTSFQDYSVKLNSTGKALGTWWTRTQEDITMKLTIWHHKQERSALWRRTFNNIPPTPPLLGKTSNSHS